LVQIDGRCEDDVMTVAVVDNPAELRYEIRVDGELGGVIRYRREPGAVVLVHTEIEPAFEGRGLGTRLAQGALDDLRARGLLVVPLCAFVAGFIARHPAYADLVTADPAGPD
jgi:predicted GNAT family acetyltransferase